MINDKSSEHKMTNNKPIVKLTDVYKIFKQGHLEVIALKNINLTVYPGELIVIMGPSGSGKTTLLNVISGMEKPSAGSIQVKELEVSRLKDEGIQKLLQYEIGIIFQFFNLIPSLTAAGNIELPMNIIKIPKEERRKRVLELLKAVGLQERAKHRPFTLSGGEKQRVAIAQAFANNPSLILADEPTGNIDSISAEKIMEIFHDTILKNPDKAIIIVTHDPAFRKIADKTLVLRDGEIIRKFDKLDFDNSSTESNLFDDDIDKMVAVEDKHKQAKDMIDNTSNYPNIEAILNCPKCGSENIIKNYDEQNVAYSANNQCLIANIAIACNVCQKIHFQTSVILDFKQNTG